MPQFMPAAEGRIRRRLSRNRSPTTTVPRFDYEAHLAAMTGPEPRWPESTRAVSELRLSFRVRPGGLLSGLRSPRTVHLDIVDYPGEWLLDLRTARSELCRLVARRRWRGSRPGRWPPTFLAAADDADATADRWKSRRPRRWRRPSPPICAPAREAGFSDCTPGRFLLPGDLEGSPALTFAPLPKRRHDPAPQPLARDGAAVRRLQGQVVQAVLPRPLRPDRPAGGAGRRARRDQCRPRGARGSAPGDGRDPRRPSAPAATPSSPQLFSARGSTGSCSPRPRPTTCTTASMPSSPRSWRR